MAKKTLTGTYAGGYALQPRFSKLLIKDTAVVEGYGLVVSAQASVSNRGSIIVSHGFYGRGAGDNGVTLDDGGQISNSGTIIGGWGYGSRNYTQNGGVGIELGAAGSVVNSGFIAGADGGWSGFKGYAYGGVGGAGISLAEGAVFNKAGTIVGGVGGSGGVTVYGRAYPSGDGGAGVEAIGFVEIINYAVIEGGVGGVGDDHYGANGGAGVAVAGGSIANAGTVSGGAGGLGDGRGGYGGIGVAASGSVVLTNTGVLLGGAGAQGVGDGGSGGGGGVGIDLAAAGSISNNHGDVIGGAGGIGGHGPYKFDRGGYGGAAGSAVVLRNGGSLENLKGDITGGAGGAGGYGYYTGGGGGAGGDGVDLIGGGMVDNFATIAGGAGGAGGAVGAGGRGAAAAGANGNGIVLTGGGTVVNRGHTSLIEGATGILVSGSAATTVINYGTIDGTGGVDPTTGVAVQFASVADRLVARAQSDFIGLVKGGGGTLELTGGTGSIAGIGGLGLASGSLAVTFTEFGAYVFDGIDAWTMTGTNSLASGQSLTNAGSLTISGTLANAGTVIAAEGGRLTVETVLANTGTLVAGGTLIAEKAITGAGVAEIDGGTLDLMAVFDQAVTFTGTTGVLELAQSQNYGQSVYGFSNTGGTTLDLGDIAFVDAGEATFSGTASGGVLTVADGKHTTKINLEVDYLDATFTASSDGHGGTAIVAETAPRSPAHAAFISTMAAFGASAPAAAHFGESWSVREPLLISPRVAIA